MSEIATGVHPDTVARGVREVAGEIEVTPRVRASGGGRKKLAVTDPSVLEDLRLLATAATRGDPMSLLTWTTKSTKNLASALVAMGHQVSDRTVAGMLSEMGFQPAGATRRSPKDASTRTVTPSSATSTPWSLNTSVPGSRWSRSTPRRRNWSGTSNNGREYQPAGEPVRVQAHDFPDKLLGKAIPYGIYDVSANTGWVSVGVDHDTSAFAVQTLRRWWENVGRDRHPKADRLLVLCQGAE